MGLMALSISWLLQVWMLPRMLQKGDAAMVREIVSPLETYFSDFQEWPAGTPEEILWRLLGARIDRVPILGQTAGEATDPNAVVRTKQELPSVNYLRDANMRAGMTLSDAWGRPLEFHFAPAGPATITSLGPDGILGTPDDVSVTANITPRKTQPTRTLLELDREFRRSQEVRRFEQARKLQDRAKRPPQD